MNRYIFLLLAAIVFSQCDTETPFHRLTVSHGTGSGVYELGQSVMIEADDAPTDQVFYSWTGDTSAIEEARSPVTRVKIPLNDLAVEATYKDLPRFHLSINNGSGSGEYLENARILVVADTASEGFVFDRWVGDTLFIEQTDTSSSYVNIPAHDVALAATYREAINYVSFSTTVFPIFETKCSYAGCHDHLDPNLPLTNYAEIKPEIGPIKESILGNTMPKTGELTPDQKEAILTWIEQGALNN